MKRRGVAIWILMAALALPAWTMARAESLEDLEIFYSSRLRYENLNNYSDLQDHQGTEGNDRASFWSMRNQFGLGATVADGVRFELEIQNLGTFGSIEPRRSDFDPVSQNTPSSGASTFGEEKSDTSLYRAVISLKEIGGSRITVDAGRQEFVLTDGLILGSEPFYGGITFDGINGWYDGGSWRAGAFWFKTRERNDPGSEFFTSPGSEDQDLYGGYGRFHMGDENGRHSVEVYGIHRNDRLESRAHANDTTVGAGWHRDVHTVAQAEANPMAWKGEFAYQMGEADFLADPNVPVDLSAWLLEGWFGWVFTSGNVLHMPYAGLYMTPGEDDLQDDNLTFWRPLFPTQHGRLGETDGFVNVVGALGFGINAYRAGYRVSTDGGRHRGEVEYWTLETDPDEVSFGTNSFEIGDLGSELDLLYSFAYRENVHLFITLAQFSPSDELADMTPAMEGDPITRIYGGFRLHSR